LLDRIVSLIDLIIPLLDRIVSLIDLIIPLLDRIVSLLDLIIPLLDRIIILLDLIIPLLDRIVSLLDLIILLQSTGTPRSLYCTAMYLVMKRTTNRQMFAILWIRYCFFPVISDTENSAEETVSVTIVFPL
jgi:hypothetical protein